MEEYLNRLIDFYKVYNDIKSKKCINCPEDKEFIINYTVNDTYQLIYTCGGEGNCGIQYTIELPKYINYNNVTNDITFKITNEVNFNALYEAGILSESEKKAISDNIEILNKELDEVTMQFNIINKLQEKENEYRRLVDLKNSLLTDSAILKKQINEDKHKESKKLKIHDYILNIKGINETIGKLEELNENIKSIFFIQDEGPKYPDKILKNKKSGDREVISPIIESQLQDGKDFDGEEEIDEYKQGYDRGYKDGYENKEYNEEGFDPDGYDEGYIEGKEEGMNEEIVIGSPKNTSILLEIDSLTTNEKYKEVDDLINKKEEEKSLEKVTNIDKFGDKNRKDYYSSKQKTRCLASITWKKLEKKKNPQEYNKYLKDINTNPKFIHFNQIYFHAGDKSQFEQYGFLKSRILGYPKNPVDDTSIFSGFNSETTYNTFLYLFNKLKKGVYISIKNNKLDTYLPFSNAEYENDWAKVLEKSNPDLVKQIAKKHFNVSDPTKWYANNCIFKTDGLKFKYKEFLSEGDKTIMIFKQFIIASLNFMNKEGKTMDDVEFFFNPRDFPVLKEDYGEPYEQIFPDKKIEDEYRHKTYTPILSQSSNDKYYDIDIPTQDDILRITTNIFPDGCNNPYNPPPDFELDFDKKQSRCIFRGSATGCGNNRKTNMRIEAALMSYELEKEGTFKNTSDQDILDIKLTSWNKKPKIYNKEFSQIDPKTYPDDFKVGDENRIDTKEQSNYKYVLNIDGHVKAFRLGNEFRMGSVVLIVKSPYTLWFMDKLEDEVNCIFINEDLTNLQERLSWCIKNDGKCKQIAKSGMDFYERYLTKEPTFNYFNDLVSNLGKIRKPPVFEMSKNKLNLIVAFRDPKNDDGSRKTQLDVFIQQMIAIFEGRTDYHIYIVQQEGDRDDYDELPQDFKQDNSKMAKFNLGRLKNIGFEIANKENEENNKSYYVLTDVDMLPSQGLIKDYLEYPETPIHLGSMGTRYDDGKSVAFLGGVLSVNSKDFMDTNGYPNNFWGWGGEDNALFQRLKDNNIKISKPEEPVIDIEDKTIEEKFEDLEKNKYKIELKNERLRQDKKDWKENGLNTLKDSYSIVSKERQGGVSEINVFLNITDKDKEEIEEIKISDFKVGTKVTWEMFGKTKCGIISKIDPKSKKNISVNEYGSGIREIAFYKLVIITDKEYKECIEPPKDKLEEIIQSVAPLPESPKPESPKPESPKPESPKPESPKPESPKPESPKPESPKPVIGTGVDVQWTEKNGKVLSGKIEKTTNKTYTICCKPNGTRYRIKKENVKLIEAQDPVIPDPVIQDPVIQDPVIPIAPGEIGTDSEVEWLDKTGKLLTGKIEKTSIKTYTICCKPNGTRYRIQKSIVKLKS